MPLPTGVFLSHASKDKPFARRLGNDLRLHGARVWIDEAEIRIGDSLIEKISDGIESTDYLVVVLTQASCESEWVRREVNIALTEEIRGRRVTVLPCLREDCTIPPFLRDKKYADFRTPKQYFKGLNELLKATKLLSTSGRIEVGPEDYFMSHFVFYDLTDLNDGFDVPTIKYFSEDEFGLVLERIESLGIGVTGIEPWYDGEFYDVRTYERHGGDPFDPKWYKQAFHDLLEDGIELQFAASYEVPEELLHKFVRWYDREHADA